MKSTDVSDSVDEGLAFTELNIMKVKHKAHLLSDNGPRDQLWWAGGVSGRQSYDAYKS